jgi:hypothetical protein
MCCMDMLWERTSGAARRTLRCTETETATETKEAKDEKEGRLGKESREVKRQQRQRE